MKARRLACVLFALSTWLLVVPAPRALAAPPCTIVGTSGDDVLTGTDGDDVICGLDGNDTLNGGLGNDTLIGGRDDDELDGGPGNDDLEGDCFACSGHDLLRGGLGNDRENGGNGNDVHDQGSAPDGADYIRGGGGIHGGFVDTVDYSQRTQPLKVWTAWAGETSKGDDGEANEHDNVHPHVNRILGGSADDILRAEDVVANQLLGGPGDDTLAGGSGNDYLDGGAGDDFMNGGHHDDTFEQGPAPQGADYMLGRQGIDTVDYSQRAGDVTITLRETATADDGESGEGDMVNNSTENALGGSGDDVLKAQVSITSPGGTFDNQLSGGAGNDFLAGKAGNDRLVGGPGDDYESGGEGDDTFWQEGAANGGDTLLGMEGRRDTVDYSARSEGVTVTMRYFDGPDDGEPGEGDFIDDRMERAVGGSGDDVLKGASAAVSAERWLNNDLFGGPGSDRLLGAGGSDWLDGGPGDDYENGGDGRDFFRQGAAANGADTLLGMDGVDDVSYALRTKSVTVTLRYYGGADDGEAGEGDRIDDRMESASTGSGADKVYGAHGAVSAGRNLNNFFTTGSGADIVSGGAGDDHLRGEGNNDKLFGGAGNDILDGGPGTQDTCEDSEGTNQFIACE